MEIPFGVQSYQHRSLPLSAQRMVNCYLEAAPPGSKVAAANVQSYGVAPWTTIGNGPLRGGLVVNGVPYVVSGGSLYRVNSSGDGASLGVIPGLGRVDMTSDGTHVLVVANGFGYLYNGLTLTQVADTDFPGSLWCEYLDGYAVIGEPSSGRVWINETITDWSTWNALDFATAEGWPDDTVGGLVDHRELFLFGRETTEVWYNSGNSDFPLERISTGFIEKGLLSTFGPGKHDNTVFFPGHDGIVYRLDGFTPIRISTHSVEQAIEGYADKTCVGMTWTEAGHSFYALKFADATWVFDISTNLWFERETYSETNWKGLFVLRAYDKWLVGDETSNKIGYLDANTFTDWGVTLRSSATAPSVFQENRWIFHNRLELMFEQGVGTSGQGENPMVMLDWSDDGGRTWSSEQFRSLGKTGEYRMRAIWNRNGRSRDRVYRYAISDPVRRTLIMANLDAEVGGY